MPSDKVFRGGATSVSDVWSYQVTAYADTTVHGVSRNGKTVGYTVVGGSETAATVASKLQALLAASTAGEFAEYSWTAAADTITGTAKFAGIPATFTKASGVTTQATLANATPAKGPNFVDDPANWGGSLPATGDRAIWDASSPDALFGLDLFRTAGVVPAKIETRQFGGVIGLPPVRGAANTFSPSPGAEYPEDRGRFLLLPAGTIAVSVGLGDTVPARVQLDLAGSGTSVDVFGGEAVYVQGTTSHPRLAVSEGTVYVAYDAGSTGGFDDVLVGDEGDQSDAKVVFGDGATVPLLHNQSGATESAATVTSLVMGLSATGHTQTDGDLTATATNGLIDFRSDGTLKVFASGTGTVVDLSRDPRPKTLDPDSTFTAGARLLDPADTRTSGSGATFDHTSLPVSRLGPSVYVEKA